jgi:hypothetical protein
LERKRNRPHGHGIRFRATSDAMVVPEKCVERKPDVIVSCTEMAGLGAACYTLKELATTDLPNRKGFRGNFGDRHGSRLSESR